MIKHEHNENCPIPCPRVAGRYDALDQETFDKYLVWILHEMPATALLGIPGIYEILAEHFNNDVLQAWENDQEEEDV